MHVINRAEPVNVAADATVGDRLMWIGPDDRGLPLEVIAILEPDYLPVIHVMLFQFRRSTP